MEISPLLKDGRFRPITWNGEKGDAAKAEAFGWNTELGARGRIKEINKHELRVDTSYQRDQSRIKARRIAAGFNWLGFGIVVVSERENGNYFVLDGGHRVMACMMRPEIKNVPCYVFTGLSKAQEAEAFVCFNANRKAPTGLELFAAQVVAGDEEARAVDRITRNQGISIGKDKTACRCPRRLVELYSSLGEPRFKSLVNVAIGAWPQAPDAERMAEQVVSGLAGFGKSLEAIGLHLSDPEVASALSRTSLRALRQNANGIREIAGKSRGEAFKLALVEAWNKGRRTHRIAV